MTTENTILIESEISRIEREYRRRESEIDADLYAPWQPAENFILSERKSTAAFLLHKMDKFPVSGEKCLEIGYGKLGWLADLLSWGLLETDLYGIELDAKRAMKAQKALPKADLRIGNAANLPWKDEAFNFILVSTVFSSILSEEIRNSIAREITRVLKADGVLIWYDLAVDNPRNKNVQGINRKNLKETFPNFDGSIKRITLAPPLCRLIAPRSFAFASLLNTIPLLRTHLLAVLVKK